MRDGPDEVDTPAVLAMMRTMVATAARPSSQPARNAKPLLRAFGVISIRMTAMIGIGLMAMPIASGRMSPIACPMCTPVASQFAGEGA